MNNRFKNNLTFFILILLLFNFIKPTGVVYADGSLSLTVIGTTYFQNFDTLISVGTGTSVSPPFPLGWHFSESGTNANATYTAGTGSSAIGDTYSFGSAGSSERAFGGLLSGSLNPTIGAQFVNNTGVTISALVVAYVGEQWRLGTAGREDRLDFQISLNATSLTTGTWTDVNSLDFTTPNTVGPTGAKDGNLPANRTSMNYTISGLNIPNGVAFWIRWLDADATGADDGLAVDDFSLTPLSAPTVTSINRASPNPTSASSVDFTVVFSKSVTGVDVSDFTLNTSGISGALVTSVSGSGATYTVSVNTGSGSGTLRLDVVDDDSIQDSTPTPLGGAGAGNGNFSSGEVYIIDKTAPHVSSILRAGPNPTNASSVDFTVTFSKSVIGVDVTDFTLSTTGISGATVTGVSGSGTTRTVSVSTGSGSGSGTLRLDVMDDDSITDSLNNPLGGTGLGNGNYSSGETYTINRSGNISLTGIGVTYSQDFNDLANTGTSSLVPNGWYFSESGSGANSLYTAGTGSSSTGDTYSFGSAGSAERALGGLQTTTLIPTIGAQLVNNTGTFINSLLVRYTGEQWRLGALSREDRLDFQLSTNATSLTTGSWVDYNNLDFIAPVTSGALGALNGNNAVNRMDINHTIGGLNIPNGAAFWIRWVDFNASGADDGLSVDDFSITPISDPPFVSSILRVNGNPTNASSVNYSVVFTKTVTGVDAADFTLSNAGISGASVSVVSGSGTTYNVVVNTGTGSGTLRLDVVDDDSILDAISVPLGGVGLGNGDYTSGETYTIDRTTSSTSAGLIVNEVSNGSSGNKEWVEFVVVGSTPTVNLSGWIIDDNNGDFDSFAVGKGIATGHLRFADPMPACPTGHSLADVPVGSRIVVYNSNDVEGPLTAYPNDPCDTDEDGVYYLPVGANPNNTTALQQCTDRPRVSPAPVDPNYSGCAYSAPAVTWDGMLLANTGDAIQSRRPNSLFYHGFSYGNLTLPPAPIFPNGNLAFIIDSIPGTQMAYQFDCGNFFSNASAQFKRVNSSLAVVGSANSMLNAAFIRGVQIGTYNYADLNDPENCRIEPAVSMSFLQAQVGVGEVAQLRVTVTNPYHSLDGFTLNLEGVNLSNNLPAGLTLSGANPVSNTCGGVFSGMPGASNYLLSGFNLSSVNPPGLASCEFVVSVIPSIAGSITNTIGTGQVTSAISGVSGGANLQPASATLTVLNTNVVKELPGTGFTPGRITTLPAQTFDNTFYSLPELWLEIPRLGIKADILGIPLTRDGWDVSWLMDQVGWLNGTAFPTWAGNSVLTAHVYDAQGLPGPFVDIHKLKWGDQLIIHAWGQKYFYEVQKVRTAIKPDDVSVLGHSDYPYLTLITCSGFDEPNQTYKWRTVVQAIQVKIN